LLVNDLQNQPEKNAQTAVLALCADLIFASKIRGAAQAAGIEARIAKNADDLVTRAIDPDVGLVLIDLDARTGVDAVAKLKENSSVHVPVICFVSHVHEAAIAAARAAGADRIMARSAFVRELPTLLRSLIAT
jgi:DNA-binding NarL/FixJ family response regulator